MSNEPKIQNIAAPENIPENTPESTPEPALQKAPLEPDPLLRRLRELTPARVALGRVGNAVPLKEVLNFQLAHSEARDAVWHAPDWGMLERGLTELGAIPLRLQSQVQSRAQYLLRPDWGRRRSEERRVGKEC